MQIIDLSTNPPNRLFALVGKPALPTRMFKVRIFLGKGMKTLGDKRRNPVRIISVNFPWEPNKFFQS